MNPDLHWRRGTITNEGEQIYWELTSTGPDDDRPVVVLSHGAGGSHGVWCFQVPVLGRSYRVLTWDSRGFGNSTLSADEPTAEMAASDLGAVLDHLGIDEPVHLIGQSMGGWHNSAFAQARPTAVRSLTLADTIGGLWTDGLRQAMADVQAAGGLRTPDPELLGHHRALWPGTGEADPARAFLYQVLGSYHSPPIDRLGAVVAFTVTHEWVAELGVPVLFVAGTHDGLFPAAALAESCALIPGARFVEIPDAGHSPYFEQPDTWNEAVLAFLDAA